MQDNEQQIKITGFLHMALPVVTDIIRTFLKTFDWEVKEEGLWLDLVFRIKSGPKEIKFFMHNLMLEIVTIDRDENPLRFDEGLRDFDYFLTKTARLVQSKLGILLQLFGQDDVDAAIENVCRDAKQYERIRIWRFDQNETDQTRDRKQSG